MALKHKLEASLKNVNEVEIPFEANSEKNMNQSHVAADVTILILSCDRYRDTWDVVIRSFTQFWPDCPYPVRLLTNNIDFNAHGVQGIPVGKDQDWSSNLLSALGKVESQRVLLWLDDVFICERVNTPTVNRVVEWAKLHQAQFVRMRPVPKPKKWDSEGFGVLGRNATYRVSVFATLWTVDALRAVAERGENPWQFELQGTERARKLDGFYATREPVFHYVHGIEKGVWLRNAVAFARKIGGYVDLEYRPQMTQLQSMLYRFRALKGRLLNSLPESSRQPILHVVKVLYCLMGIREGCSARSVLTSFVGRFQLTVAGLVERYGISRDGVLHVGANFGQEADDYDAVGFQRVLWVEGHKPYYETLLQVVGKRPNHRSLHLMVSDVEGEQVNFSIASNTGSSTALEVTQGWRRTFEEIALTEGGKVACGRLDRALDASLPKEWIDNLRFLVLDIEGSELKALRSLGRYLERLDFALIEISLRANFVGGPLFADIDRFMRTSGFRRRYVKVSASSGDALYQRVDTLSPVEASLMAVSAQVWQLAAWLRLTDASLRVRRFFKKVAGGQ